MWLVHYGHAIARDDIRCEGSARLYYDTYFHKVKSFLLYHGLSLDDCSNTCYDCDGCVAYVDNREKVPPYCVFKHDVEELYVTLKKEHF